MRITSSMLQNLYGSRASSRTNSIRNSWSMGNAAKRTSGFSTNSLRSNSYQKTDIAQSYQKTQKGAAGVREQAESLTDTSEDSLWAKAEKSGSNKEVVDYVKQFVSDYNDMVSGMQKTGGSLNNIYRSQLNTAAKNNQQALSEIGITTNRDGTLSADVAKLGKADLESIKEVFAGSSSFAGQTAVKSIYVEANAVSGMTEQANASYLGYNSFGNYNSFSSYGSYGASLGNYFNTLF